jgi:uncharacterized membrane protein (Fun14 family)
MVCQFFMFWNTATRNLFQTDLWLLDPSLLALFSGYGDKVNLRIVFIGIGHLLDCLYLGHRGVVLPNPWDNCLLVDSFLLFLGDVAA